MLISTLSLHQWSEVAAIVTVAGVGLVLLQIHQGARVARVELITGLTTLIVAIDQMFIEHPGMWRYFNENVPLPEEDTTERERANAIALAMANTLDHIVEHLTHMKCRTRYSWCAYIEEVYEKSPVFRDLLDEHRTWWPGLQEQVRDLALKP